MLAQGRLIKQRVFVNPQRRRHDFYGGQTSPFDPSWSSLRSPQSAGVRRFVVEQFGVSPVCKRQTFCRGAVWFLPRLQASDVLSWSSLGAPQSASVRRVWSVAWGLPFSAARAPPGPTQIASRAPGRLLGVQAPARPAGPHLFVLNEE